MKPDINKLLDSAQSFANTYSGCNKVAVGSILITCNLMRLYGENKSFPDCRKLGCRRIALYGEDSKNHRLPSDCRSLHSEITVISKAAKMGISTNGATLMVTRYPCEACARAIVNAGIKKVYYGRNQEISEETEKILKSGNVEFLHVRNWTYDDVER